MVWLAPAPITPRRFPRRRSQPKGDSDRSAQATR